MSGLAVIRGFFWWLCYRPLLFLAIFETKPFLLKIVVLEKDTVFKCFSDIQI